MEIVKDSEGRIVYMSREDGYEEITTYNIDGSYKVDTIYPNGRKETERFMYFSTTAKSRR